MKKNFLDQIDIQFVLRKESLSRVCSLLERFAPWIIAVVLSIVSVASFLHYYQNGLGLSYNDARLHLDIGRRVVEGLNTGFAQLGSVWLPLTHLLISATVWSDFMWHSGLAGALWSMLSFVATGILVYLILKEIGVGLLGRYVGVIVFATNINILYMQSTAMTELMLLSTMTAGAYYLIRWFKTEHTLHLIYAAFFIMLSSLVRYDGWFMFFFATVLISIYTFRKSGYWHAEGIFVFFCTLAGLGVFLWLLWNTLIFKDPLYFAFGPYSAHSQQLQLEGVGELPTKWHWLSSIRIYLYALTYNTGAFTLVLGGLGALIFWMEKKIKPGIRLASAILMAPLLFNILALYLGHSVLSIEGVSGSAWFNVRYGLMMMPSVAIFVGFFVDRFRFLRIPVLGLLFLVIFFQLSSHDAVTVDDARFGSSQKDVTEIAGWLREHAQSEQEFTLISSVSHDAVIFTSGLPMRRFIHEGSGVYYDEAVKYPDYWVRWIVLKTGSPNDATWVLLHDNPAFSKYELMGKFPFADVYELREEYRSQLKTHEVLESTSQDRW